jgi:hypothetical protein
MADNYLLFSEAVDELTPEEEAWLRERLEEGPVRDAFVAEAVAADPSFDGEMFPGFQWELKTADADDDDGLVATYLWVYSEDNGNVDHVVVLVQAFLVQFRQDYAFTISWAETCSKPRIGEFSGGAAMVTARKKSYLSAAAWVFEQAELEAALGGPAKA